MAFKHFAFIAIMGILAVPALCGVAFAEENLSAKPWAPPNVAGMPGYKEPPKVEEIRMPIPRTDPRYGGHQVQHSNAPDAKQ